jgi:hypothetical protein
MPPAMMTWIRPSVSSGKVSPPQGIRGVIAGAVFWPMRRVKESEDQLFDFQIERAPFVPVTHDGLPDHAIAGEGRGRVFARSLKFSATRSDVASKFANPALFAAAITSSFIASADPVPMLLARPRKFAS